MVKLKNYYRPYELAQALDEPVQNIYRLMRLGLIQHIRVDRKIKIPRETFERVLREGIARQKKTPA